MESSEGPSGVDLSMFDDLLSCISEQYDVQLGCVGSLGVSAGGLWTTYLGNMRGEYLATNQTISGGHPPDIGWYPWDPPPHGTGA